jgi:hypothetical protein
VQDAVTRHGGVAMRFTIQKRSGGRRRPPLLHFLVLLTLGWPALAEPVSIKGFNTWVLASLPDNLQQVLDLGVSIVNDRPIWVTELGYISRPVVTGGRTDYGSPEKQGAWLTAAVHQAQALGVERAFWLFVRDAPNAGYFGSMGLLGAGNVPRPAWQAYKAIGQR